MAGAEGTTRRCAGWWLAMTGLVLGACAMSATGEVTGFVQRNGRYFVVDGRRACFAGTNNYYQMIRRRTDSPGVDEVLDEMAARGMNLLRTWAFQDDATRTSDCLICAPAAQLGTGQRPIDFVNEQTLVGLDETLAACRVRGIRVVLTLANNWDDFGGMNRWTLWRFGEPDHDRFYTDATIRAWFKELIAMLANRTNTVNGQLYQDDPTIFAWQLTNEARLMSGTATADDLNAWFGEMSAYVKSLDTNHMVTTGIEGFYCGENAGRNTDAWMAGYGQDFIENHRHATIDYATCHIWPQNFGWDPIGSTPSALMKAAQYLQRRIDDAATVLGKPVMLDEFGIPRDDFGRGPGGPTTVRDQFFLDAYFVPAEASVRSGGAFGGWAVWIMFDDSTVSWDDGNGIFLPQDASTDALLTRHARSLTQPEDFDGDGDVDLGDFGRFRGCFNGANRPAAEPGCGGADLDGDQDVDLTDFDVFRACFNGPNRPPACR